MTSESSPNYPIRLLCKDCTKDLDPNATEGACWISKEADKLVLKVREEEIDPNMGKQRLSKLSQTGNQKKCPNIIDVRNRNLPRISLDFDFLTKGHALFRSTNTPKEK